MKELIYCPFCGLETHILVGEFGCSYFGCIKDKSCYGYAMKHCVNDDKLESEIAAWNKRAPSVPVLCVKKEEKPAPVEWQAETQEFVINGCQVIVRTRWKECDDHRLEVAVMLESDRAAHGCDSIKIGLQFPKSLFIGELLHAIWGFKVQEPVSGKTFRKVTVKFTGSLNKAKASAKIYVQESVRGRLEQIVRFDMLQKL